MPNKIIIHTHDGEKISDELLATIFKLSGLQESAEVSYLSDHYHLTKSYITRLSAVTAAFERVCNAVTPPLRDVAIAKSYIKMRQGIYLNALEDPSSVNILHIIYFDYLHHVRFVLGEMVGDVDAAAELLEKADEYEVLLADKPVLATLIPFDHHYLLQMEVPKSPFSEEMREEIWAAKTSLTSKPNWYQGMSNNEKMLFDHMMASMNSIDDLNKIVAISSRHRTIPGVANFSLHELAIIDTEGVIYHPHPRYRSSMVASRDVESMQLTHPERLRVRHKFTLDNMTHIIETFIKDVSIGERAVDVRQMLILMQTLISPMLLPDNALYDDKSRAISDLRARWSNQILNTNHPVNLMRHLDRTGSVFESGETTSRIQQQLEQVNELIVRLALEDLSETLRNVPSVFSSFLNDQGRELHIAALEQIVVSHILDGLAYGSCVSGKDRKALEIIYCDSMLLYFWRNQTLPRFGDTGRARDEFINLFSDLYISRHQQLNAGQNAPGSDGIKTADLYLPTDIVNRIRQRSGRSNIFSVDNRLASNNDFRDVLKAGCSDGRRSRFVDYWSSFIAMHKSITVASTRDQVDLPGILEKFKIIINSKYMENRGVTMFGSKKVPGGIQEMRDVIARLQSNENPLKSLLSIEDLVFELGEISEKRLAKAVLGYSIETRRSSTKLFYEEMIRLKDYCLFKSVAYRWNHALDWLYDAAAESSQVSQNSRSSFWRVF